MVFDKHYLIKGIWYLINGMVFGMIPTPGSSETSMSTKTPIRDLGDSRSLDRVPDVGS